MREFEYFLFENFDACEESDNPDNPRNLDRNQANAVLSYIAEQLPGRCSYNKCTTMFGSPLMGSLVNCGLLRCSENVVVFDSPIFLQEDADTLEKETSVKAVMLVDLLEMCLSDIQTICAGIQNGFSVARNLYHILCGMVLDGYLFDYLSTRGTLTVSRTHASGLDYLSVIYEKCVDLQVFSDRRLCSYNRLVNNKCALQSFGDANGNRFDFYRFFRLLEQGYVPEKFKNAETLLGEHFGKSNKDELLEDVYRLVQSGKCSPAAVKLLNIFGYTNNGTICVPVFRTRHQNSILKISKLVEECIGEAISNVLADLAGTISITAAKHGVNRLEVANELYHIVFGAINEELTVRGIVAAPTHIPGEGRYLKCIEIYD